VKWTSEKPKKAGHYWYRAVYLGEASILHVRDLLNVCGLVAHYGLREVKQVSLMHGHWSGPIPEPEEE
jgi:hypothetical protein